jgi:hypothetical protein
MADLNATTYNKILSKGIEANLPVNIGVNKLRFTTDTGRLFLDNEGTDRVEITDFVKGKTKDEILGTLAPLPKFYFASDTQEIYYYDTTGDEWKSISVSTTQYAVESGHSINADTASYATNASSSSYSNDAISNITRNGLVFTVTKNDNSTFTFDQQDNDTTYALATTASSGLMPALEGGTTKYLRADGSWGTVATSDTKVTQTESTANNNYEVLLSNNASTAEETDGVKKSSGMKYNPFTGNLTISGNLTDKFGLQSIRRISEAEYNALSTEEKNNGTIYNIYDKTGSSAILPGDFVGATTATAGEHGLVPAPTTADVEKFLKGDGTWAESTDTTYDNMTINEGVQGSSTISRVMTAANLKGILQGSTYIYSYAPCVEADFDFGELTANSEVYNQ